MAKWSRVREGTAVTPPSQGQAWAIPGNAVFSRLPASTQSLFLVLCLPSPEYAGYKAILSSFLITSTETLLRDKSVTSRWHCSLKKTTQKQKPEVSLPKNTYLLCFISQLGWEEGKKSWREYFPFTFEKLSGSASSEEQSWVFSDGSVESKKSIISVIKCL